MECKLTILTRALLAVALVAITLVMTYEFRHTATCGRQLHQELRIRRVPCTFGIGILRRPIIIPTPRFLPAAPDIRLACLRISRAA